MKKMATIFASAIAALALATIQTQARPYHRHHAQHRHQTAVSYTLKTPLASGEAAGALIPLGAPTVQPEANLASRRLAARAPGGDFGMAYLPHPSGCPAIKFCACGASVRLFGRSIRGLWPVSAWYAFPRAMAAPGRVVIPHPHHLYVLEYQISGPIWMTSDYNSGDHESRRQPHDISGMIIVDPSNGYQRMARR
jgi:hypothetical protein